MPRLGRAWLIEEDLNFMIKQISLACENLAQNKLGALIAIEKNDSPAAYTQSGEIIDSRICARI